MWNHCYRGHTSTAASIRMGGGQSKYELMDDAEKQLKLILGSMKSLSAKEDFIRSLRYSAKNVQCFIPM